MGSSSTSILPFGKMSVDELLYFLSRGERHLEVSLNGGLTRALDLYVDGPEASHVEGCTLIEGGAIDCVTAFDACVIDAHIHCLHVGG